MNTKIILIIAFTVLVVYSQFSLCQKPASARETNNYEYTDTTKKIMPANDDEFFVNVRTLENKIFDKYKNDPSFNYDNAQQEPQDWIGKIRNWINQQLAIIRSSKTYSTILDYFYYGLAILAVFLIIRGLIKGDRRGLFFGQKIQSQIKVAESEEDIMQINFDELLSIAIANKDFKLATRYLFLKTLKLLSEKEFIQLKNNKTNHQYLSEIKNDKISEAFSKATSHFEWIWYGDFPVDENVMRKSQDDFNNLFKLIAA
ncbi:MAG: hypothetical protein P8Y18_07295 [Candidatus Bathyarchaeota archaeon]